MSASVNGGTVMGLLEHAEKYQRSERESARHGRVSSSTAYRLPSGAAGPLSRFPTVPGLLDGFAFRPRRERGWAW
jgi:hypothetical protein